MASRVEYGVTKSVTLSWKHIREMIKAGAPREKIRAALSALYRKAFKIGGPPKMFIIDEEGNRVEYKRGPSKYQLKQQEDNGTS